ncbi:MAG TPA: NAD(P)(+) transhydrogenase (Re/Si-specific) subunit beta, partial [Gemmataceae bacterium]|nr:NAD(P)(+) transhydrogenase (Re/Si-specific) subunit beta [Gemmataceae bacterium]
VAIELAGGPHTLGIILGSLAVIAASTNVIGGFLITDRMLKMFKSRRAEGPTSATAHVIEPTILGTGFMIVNSLVTAIYLATCACFVLSLRWLSSPVTARRGVRVGEIGMALAICGAFIITIMSFGGEAPYGWLWILISLAIGAAIGIPMAVLMPMTAVPQRTALSHAFGGLAASLVGVAHYYLQFIEYQGTPQATFHPLTMAILALEVLLGGVTFTGSLMAFAKLQELIPTRPITYKNQNIYNLSLLGFTILIGIILIICPTWTWLMIPYVLLAMAFGVLLILPIGGADMPTVITLLNSYAGLSASMMGFVLDYNLLIVAGALDGSSGLILSILMCRAMNRSFTNVLFGAFGQVQVSAEDTASKTYRSTTAEEAAQLLQLAGTVAVVPGYGMAVAQAQHAVRELYQRLTESGVEVKFAIHPVAGRMPGHMNVLLAEANIPYEALSEMDEINREFPQVDVALVIGANDVTNPAARHNKSSPIYGMPILDVDKARNVIVIKRSMNPGFAGIDNELYYLDKTLMLFGDAKGMVSQLVKEMEAAGVGAH